MALNQESRFLTIETALGSEALVVRSISVHEQVGRLFQIEAELASEDASLKFDDVLGHNATLRLALGPKTERFFNGFVSRFVQVANKGGLARYRATIVPWLWFLTRTADCRSFQEKTVPEILEEVFQGHGFSDFELRLNGTYEKREFCVQYRESDFNFVSRLMEQEGIYYFFEHENGKHLLVLADSISAHTPFPEYEAIPFQGLERGGNEREVVTDWTVETEVQPVAYALNDFDFKKPKAALLASASVTRQHGAASFEVYDYPGEYIVSGEGTRLSDVRLAELQSQFNLARGQSTARGIAAGRTFKLEEHPREDQNKEYLITSSSLFIETGDFETERRGESAAAFSCRFTALDSEQPFRSARTTPKPVVQGPQTAIVVGPSGEEIHTDEHGRVKLHFHWDRYSKADENSSCWVRVSQGWAGKTWGAIYMPRIGQEVIVEFLEGDPDRPIITGRVYNADAMPPYALPDNKTMSTLKSNSSKGGGGFNEIRFEDKKGDEQIFIHGEKNEDVRIKNDCFEWIGHDRHLVVKNNQTEHVENNRDEIVGADHKEKIGKDRHLKVVGKEAKEVDGSQSLTVKGDVIEVFKANQSTVVTADHYLKADNIVIEGLTNVTVKVGDSYIAIESGGIKIGTTGTIELDSTGETSIKAKAAIKVEATAALEMKGTASVKLESPATVDVKGSMTTVKGDGMLTLKGGAVMIN